jgi:hypothetical protein
MIIVKLTNSPIIENWQLIDCFLEIAKLITELCSGAVVTWLLIIKKWRKATFFLNELANVRLSRDKH